MARDLGVSTPTVFAAFSVALIVSALLGPQAGARHRPLGRSAGAHARTSVVFAAGPGRAGLAHGPLGLFAAWVVLGVGMGSGLYEAAFAALVRLYGKDSRNAITGITLIAGFASTVGWPLSTLLEAQVGWRGACLAWAALHLLIGLPLNAAAAAGGTAPEPGAAQAPAAPMRSRQQPARRCTAVARCCRSCSPPPGSSARRWRRTCRACCRPPACRWPPRSFVGALIGPAQVGARLLEFGLLRKVHPLLSARLAAAMHPLGVALLRRVGAPAAAVFGILHGAGNGILTIAKGTLPLVLFGPQGYGHRQGLLMVPARFAQALAPWLFGLALDQWGAGALAVSAAVGALAFLALFILSIGTRQGAETPKPHPLAHEDPHRHSPTTPRPSRRSMRRSCSTPRSRSSGCRRARGVSRAHREDAAPSTLAGRGGRERARWPATCMQAAIATRRLTSGR